MTKDEEKDLRNEVDSHGFSSGWAKAVAELCIQGALFLSELRDKLNKGEL